LFSIGLLVILIISFYGYRDIPLTELKAKYAQSPSAFISIDGMDVHYRDEGNPTDTIPIVLIHGTASSLHTFDNWTATLKNNRRVLRMDIPGFGLTGPFVNQQYSIANYASFIDHFLVVKGVKKCILAGNSLGGHIAWQFAVKYPDKVAKLILIDASGYPIESEDVPIAFKIASTPVLNKIMTFITPRFVVRSSVENVYADKTKVTDALVDRYFDLTLRAGNRQALVDRMKLEKVPNAFTLIKTIQQPTLILWGAEDLLITTQSAYRFQKDLPNSTLQILKNVGHVPMEESPQESLAAVLDFLKK
jgi:pimeloyl-ACP methyl ester carboxylesterase